MHYRPLASLVLQSAPDLDLVLWPSSPPLSPVLFTDHITAPFQLRAPFLRLLQDADSLCESACIKHTTLSICRGDSTSDRHTSGLSPAPIDNHPRLWPERHLPSRVGERKIPQTQWETDITATLSLGSNWCAFRDPSIAPSLGSSLGSFSEALRSCQTAGGG